MALQVGEFLPVFLILIELDVVIVLSYRFIETSAQPTARPNLKSAMLAVL